MGLPTAQLGSMSSLNIPSYLPTTVVRKDPRLWEQALLSLLTSTAGAVIGKGVDNVMSRDFADPSLNEKPASFLGRALRGPTVDRAESTRRATSKEADNRLIAQVAGQIGLQELADAPGPRDVTARNEAELNRSASAQNTMRGILAQSQLSRREGARADEREAGRQKFETTNRLMGQRFTESQNLNQAAEAARVHDAQIAASNAATAAQEAATKLGLLNYTTQKKMADRQAIKERQTATAKGAERLRKEGAFESGEKSSLMQILSSFLPTSSVEALNPPAVTPPVQPPPKTPVTEPKPEPNTWDEYRAQQWRDLWKFFQMPEKDTNSQWTGVQRR